MKKGFTLIELLAVIVILAIIAVIATPIIINVIDNTKNESLKMSAQNYLDAVELSIAKQVLNKDDNNKISGNFEIIENGKKIKSLDTNKEIKVEFDGEGLNSGIVVIENGCINRLIYAKLGDKKIELQDGIIVFNNDEYEKNTLTKGQNFNAKIKSLVSGETKTYSADDQVVTSIEFLSGGLIPSGYTKEELLELEKVDVSLKQDESILALTDGAGKVYIYSDKLISFGSDVSYLFNKLKNLIKIEFREIDTSNMTNMTNMFFSCSNLKKLDLKKFNTSKVTSMYGTFDHCSSLENLNIVSFDTSKVTSMFYMFRNCSKLKELDVSSFDVRNVTDMFGMFQWCSSLKYLDLSNFKTNSLGSMNWMFDGCNSLETLDVSNFNTSKVTSMTWLFRNCYKLKEIDISSFDLSKVENMGSMFQNCSSLKEIDLSNLTESKVTSMSGLFNGCSSLEKVDLSNLKPNQNVNMSSMFSYCNNLNEVDFGNNIIKVNDMGLMFNNCSSIKTLDISNFDTTNLTSTSHTFNGCRNLKTILVGDKWVIGDNVNQTNMFNYCGTNIVTFKSTLVQ